MGTPVIASDGTVFIGTSDLHVYAVSSKGTLFYAVNTKGSVRTGPAIGVGPVLYVSTTNALVAISP